MRVRALPAAQCASILACQEAARGAEEPTGLSLEHISREKALVLTGPSYCRTPVSRMKIICRPRPAEPDLLFFKKSHGK